MQRRRAGALRHHGERRVIQPAALDDLEERGVIQRRQQVGVGGEVAQGVTFVALRRARHEHQHIESVVTTSRQERVRVIATRELADDLVLIGELVQVHSLRRHKAIAPAGGRSSSVAPSQ